MVQFENFQKLGKDNVDATLKSFGVVQKGLQTVAVEFADFAKKAYELATATIEKLASARTLEKALEIQTEYLKASYESFVAQTAKMGEFYSRLAKEAYAPLEGVVGRPLKA